jgi:hypothetical protein
LCRGDIYVAPEGKEPRDFQNLGVLGFQDETLAPVFCGEEILVEPLFPAGTKNRTYRKIPAAITATSKRIIGKRFINAIVSR